MWSDSYHFFGRLIDCKYFDFGNGTCPFGASCFYKVSVVYAFGFLCFTWVLYANVLNHGNNFMLIEK